MGENFYTYATERDAEAWQRMLSAIEQTLPTAPLAYATDRMAKPRRVDDPAAWCAERFTGLKGEMICNMTEDAFVSFGPCYLYANIAPGGRALDELTIDLPQLPAFTAALPALVAAFGPAARAIRGEASPQRAGVALSEGVGRRSQAPPPGTISPSALTPVLGWVSWWSDATCDHLGFSLDDPRARLFARVTPVPGQGVVLQLTDDPLDLDRADHLAAATAVYRAFPAIDHKWDA